MANKIDELWSETAQRLALDAEFAADCRQKCWIMQRPFLPDEMFCASLFVAYARFSGYLSHEECATLAFLMGDELDTLFRRDHADQVTVFRTCTNIADWRDQEAARQYRAGLVYALLANVACPKEKLTKCVY